MPVRLLYESPPPARPLEQCSDEDRRITKRCWDLDQVQDALRRGALVVALTTSASRRMRDELNWQAEDAKNFILALGLHRYTGSEWCLPPADGNAWGPLQGDVYCMGFDRFKGEENARRTPPIYIKFSIKGRALIVFSLHPSDYL